MPDPAFIETLPEDIRGDPAFAEIKDVGTLAKNYLAARQPAEFTTLLPEEIRGEAYFKDLRDVPALATKAFNQAKLIGRLGDPERLVLVPGADATPEDWATVWGRLGRPEAPDKYQLADPEKIPEGLTINPESKTQFAAKAHELGLSQKQADALYQHINAGRIAGYSAVVAGEQTALAEVETALKRELGQAYDRAAEDGNLAVDHLDKKLQLNGGLEAAIGKLPAGSRAALFKAFALVGAGLREDGTLLGQGGGGGFGDGLTPAQALQQRSALFADKDFMAQFRSPNKAIREGAIAKMQVLNEAIAAGQASAA